VLALNCASTKTATTPHTTLSCPFRAAVTISGLWLSYFPAPESTVYEVIHWTVNAIPFMSALPHPTPSYYMYEGALKAANLVHSVNFDCYTDIEIPFFVFDGDRLFSF